MCIYTLGTSTQSKSFQEAEEQHIVAVKLNSVQQCDRSLGVPIRQTASARGNARQTCRLPPSTKKSAWQIMTILGVIRSVLVLPPISATVAALAANAALVPGVHFGEEHRSPNPYMPRIMQRLKKVKLVKSPFKNTGVAKTMLSKLSNLKTLLQWRLTLLRKRYLQKILFFDRSPP